MIVAGDPTVNIDFAVGGVGLNSEYYPAWWICLGQDNGGYTVCDGPYLFCLCPWCGKVGVEFDGRGARVCGYKEHFKNEEAALSAIKHLGHWRADDKCYTANHVLINLAATKARQARFEYGDSDGL
jgi:hypothetical protein